ncbi:MAG: lipocalin family protein [Candidatus Riflebacteria bacterium]|nr:lipocalin family protein [Candidatus Riflebacteria bacterium]
MRFNSHYFFRNIFLLAAIVSSLLLTACGGGGGGGGGGDGLREALVGTWYLNFEDGLPVVPNSKGEVDTMILKSDGTCSMKTFDLTNANHSTYWEPEGTVYNDSGTWSYSNGNLITKIDGYTMSVSVTFNNGALILNGTEPEPWTSTYKKTKYGESQDSGGGSSQVATPTNTTNPTNGGGSSQPVTPSNPTTITKNDLVGTWYLNIEDGLPVVPNSKGDVSSMILKSDGTCTMKDYDLTTYGHSGYYEPEATVYNDTGTWSYSNGKLTTVIEGYSMSVSVTLKDGSLTLNGTEPEPWTSVYKKTKYSL